MKEKPRKPKQFLSTVQEQLNLHYKTVKLIQTALYDDKSVFHSGTTQFYN